MPPVHLGGVFKCFVLQHANQYLAEAARATICTSRLERSVNSVCHRATVDVTATPTGN